MEKDIILGAADLYDWDKVRVWARSIRDVGFLGDVILLVYRTTNTVIEECHKLNIGVIQIDHDNFGNPINHNDRGRDTQAHQMRFFHIWQFLENCDTEYRNVIITDIRDVVFQKNPSDWPWPVPDGIIAPSESILFENESWNLNNVTNAFGPYVSESLKEFNVYNVGTIGGPLAKMKGLCLTLYLMGVGHYIPNDQAAFNVLLSHYMLESVFRTSSDSFWAAQCGTTMDITKSYLWPYLTDFPPSFDGEKVRNFNGDAFVMVHQWERVAELKEFFEKKYGY